MDTQVGVHFLSSVWFLTRSLDVPARWRGDNPICRAGAVRGPSSGCRSCTGLLRASR